MLRDNLILFWNVVFQYNYFSFFFYKIIHYIHTQKEIIRSKFGKLCIENKFSSIFFVFESKKLNFKNNKNNLLFLTKYILYILIQTNKF